MTLDRSQIPDPIFDERPDFIELYWKAWEYARNHVLEKRGAPQSPYMDEALEPNMSNMIWIWDTNFMALYCKYAPHYFPGIESLNNFYLPLHDHIKTSLKIHHPDNPPLFAWVEYEYFLFTGDLARLRWILLEKKYLQKHYYFIEHSKRFRKIKSGVIPTYASKQEFGYRWRGTPSGMDNTPRGRSKYGKILWLDLLAQQALAAENILKISSLLKDSTYVHEFDSKYKEIKEIMNKWYWNDQDGIYYDIKKNNPSLQVKVKTPAAFWPMLAGLCSNKQAEKLIKHAIDPNCFGSEAPWPSVARDDPDFSPGGCYWRGGIWLPLAYMAIKALERFGYFEIADSMAENLITHMSKTYKEYQPHTIWEVYSPTEPKPSTYKRNRNVFRPNFCGWSALGPIALFIENVLGFHRVNALEKKVEWRLYRKGRHGILNFRFGPIITDIVYENDTIKINSNEDYSLIVNNQKLIVKKGVQTFKI